MKAERYFILALLVGIFCATINAQNIVRNDDIHKSDTISEVVVTGTGTEHLLRNVPVQTEVISRKQIDAYGGKSIEDILGGLTSSFSFNEGDMGSQMQLNGLGNNYILILINGKRIHGDNGGENDLGLIDPHDIERIEIVKGAQSALYSSDAIAGVINIITKRHDTEGLLLENTTRYGCYNDLRQHNGVAFTAGNLQSYTKFQLQHSDGWQNTSEEYAEGRVLPDSKTMTVNKHTNWQIGEQLNYKLKNNIELYAEGTFYKKVIYRPVNGNYPSCDVYTYNLMYNNASAATGGKWILDNNKKDYITLDIDWNKHAYFYKYTNRTYEDAYIGGALEHGVPFYAGQKRLQSDQQRVMGQLKGIFHLPYRNVINTGLEYRYDYLDAPMRTANGSASDKTAALYIQDEFTALEWINITTGFRIVDNANYGLHFIPKVSSMVSMDNWRFRIGWSQGFKSPTVKELYYRYLHVMGSSTFFNIGNTSLKPQTSNNFSANIEYRTNRLTTSVTGYINKLINMITLVNVSVDEIPKDVTTAYLGDGSSKLTARMYKNMDDAKTYGLDFNLSYKITADLSLTCNYSYLDTKSNHYDASSDRMVATVIDGMAHHKWNAIMTYGKNMCKSYRLGASVSTRGSSKRYYENNGNGKAFQIWRINTTHDFGRTEKKVKYHVELGMDNIFNYKDTTMHPYHLGTTTAGRTAFISFAVKFIQGKKINNNNNNKQKQKQNNDEED